MPVVVIQIVKDAVSIVIFIMNIKNPIIVIILIIDMIPFMTQNMSLLYNLDRSYLGSRIFYVKNR